MHHESEETAGNHMSATANLGRSPQLRILLLEDSQILAEIMKLFILGWFRSPKVIIHGNGDLAWADLVRQDPDLLITDRKHPGLDGDELVRRLAARQAKFPILMLSGDPNAIENPPPDLRLLFLPKPFNRDSLWVAVNDLAGPCDFPVRPQPQPAAAGQTNKSSREHSRTI
jgi:CheY-like chemotaxis protein